MRNSHITSSPNPEPKRRTKRRVFACAALFQLALHSLTPALSAAESDCDGEQSPVVDVDRRLVKRASKKVEPAQLNAFGCEGPGGATFAGRYQSIDVFADVAKLGVGKRVVKASVYGHLVAGLLPPMLSAALVEWNVAWEESDNTILLFGIALRPDGAELLVRLRLPRGAGSHTAEIRTTNLGTGVTTSEPVICTVR